MTAVEPETIPISAVVKVDDRYGVSGLRSRQVFRVINDLHLMPV